MVAYALLILGILTTSAFATDYHVAFDTGDDARSGLTPDTAFKRCPGDSEATGIAAAVKLQPGDRIRFKGGVIYRGRIAITQSGNAGLPIVYDGNHAGDWGEGLAIIDGSVPFTDLQRCANAAEARGNPNWQQIYRGTVPAGAKWNSLNVCQENKALSVSQDPNPVDPIFQEDIKNFIKTEPEIPETTSIIQVRAIKPMLDDATRPLVCMFEPGHPVSAVIDNINGGGEVEIALLAPVTVVEFSVTPAAADYTQPKEMRFLVDGKEVLCAQLQLADYPGKTVEQRFTLPHPLTFQTMVVRFVSAYPSANGKVRNWGCVQAISGYDAAGKNVLLTERKSSFVNAAYFTQKDPDFFSNALLSLYAKPAAVYYKRILGYDPAQHRISFETLAPGETPYDKGRGGAFSIMNAVQHIDMPGEYALILDPEKDGRHRIFVWPPNGKTEGLTYSRYHQGFCCSAKFITIQGFWIRKQGWSDPTGVEGFGGNDLTIRNVKITGLRGNGVGIHTGHMDQVLVEDSEVSENAGHTKGIVLADAKNIVVRRCLLRRNSSTALDYYTITNGVVQDCRVIENAGMHANALTFYVGCRDILVERNEVRECNAALTVQDGENMIVRDNIFDAGVDGGSPTIGLWAGGPFNNILITHNLLLSGAPNGNAIYGGNPGAKGYTIVNNVIDGFGGLVARQADFHHNIFLRSGPGLRQSQLGNNRLVTNLTTVCVDPAKRDYRLLAGSPAIGAGTPITSITRHDRDGVVRGAQGAIDIGPYEFTPPGAVSRKELIYADPQSFHFSFDGITFTTPAPVVVTYTPRFAKRSGAETRVLKGVDRSGEGGYAVPVNLRLPGGYISGWDNPGHWLEWTVEAENAGSYEVAIYSASETPAVRQVFLNGKPVAGLEAVKFSATGSWREFEPAGLPAPLQLTAGKNVIRFVNVEGSLNFKKLEFIPVNADSVSN